MKKLFRASGGSTLVGKVTSPTVRRFFFSTPEREGLHDFVLSPFAEGGEFVKAVFSCLSPLPSLPRPPPLPPDVRVDSMLWSGEVCRTRASSKTTLSVLLLRATPPFSRGPRDARPWAMCRVASSAVTLYYPLICSVPDLLRPSH